MLESDALWENDTKGGPGLYAKAKVVDTWQRVTGEEPPVD